jgi:hypothetical protein
MLARSETGQSMDDGGRAMKYKMLIEQAQKLVKQAEGLLAEYEGKDLPAEKLAVIAKVLLSITENMVRYEGADLVRVSVVDLETETRLRQIAGGEI